MHTGDRLRLWNHPNAPVGSQLYKYRERALYYVVGRPFMQSVYEPSTLLAICYSIPCHSFYLLCIPPTATPHWACDRITSSAKYATQFQRYPRERTRFSPGCRSFSMLSRRHVIPAGIPPFHSKRQEAPDSTWGCFNPSSQILEHDLWLLIRG